VKFDAEIDRLYGLPLDEFVSERDGLAKRLRKDGDREAAERVKALRKPTAGAWAINQAVRRRERERDKLLAAGERLRKAHEALLSGGDPAALRKAMGAERELAGSLADVAEVIASETGKSGPALRERVRGTLHAAAVDEQVRGELAAGRVVRERDAVGLGPFGAAAEAPPSRSGRAGAERAGAVERDRDKASRGTRKQRGTTAADRRTEERERAKRERAEHEQVERDRAERLAAAERRLAAANAALTKAQAAHAAASGVLDTARRALDDAQAAERETRTAERERAREVAKREREVEKLRAGNRRRG
jgi:hypothetical protein